MNLFQWMGRFSQVLERPFAIGWTPYTLKCMLGSLLLYGCGIALYYSNRENRRPGEEYGSAKWGNPKELNRKYMDHQHKDANIILTQRVRLGMDGYITQRNMNVLVVGGSGSGKTRFFCKPNIYSANCSYLITDPKGELLRAAGGLLVALGYEVRVFNLIDPSQSDGYNPFSYIHSEKDVLTLIDNLIKNTTPRNASSNDPFWERGEIALDSALMLYLVSEAPSEEQNFETLIYMMNFADVKEEDEQYRSPLDMLFRALEEEQPNHVAVKQYAIFKQAAGMTALTFLRHWLIIGIKPFWTKKFIISLTYVPILIWSTSFLSSCISIISQYMSVWQTTSKCSSAVIIYETTEPVSIKSSSLAYFLTFQTMTSNYRMT